MWLPGSVWLGWRVQEDTGPAGPLGAFPSSMDRWQLRMEPPYPEAEKHLVHATVGGGGTRDGSLCVVVCLSGTIWLSHCVEQSSWTQQGCRWTAKDFN